MRSITLFLSLIAVIGLLSLPAQAGWDPDDSGSSKKKSQEQECRDAIAEFKKKDSDLNRFFNKAHAYAVFPNVGKGGFGIGGAHGKGLVFQGGKVLGRTTLTQATIGFQLGGQVYAEIIFFEDAKALKRFTDENFEFSAQASAVAITAGASADAAYEDGVAVFTMAKGGLMYEASIGGQKFSYKKK